MRLAYDFYVLHRINRPKPSVKEGVRQPGVCSVSIFIMQI